MSMTGVVSKLVVHIPCVVVHLAPQEDEIAAVDFSRRQFAVSVAIRDPYQMSGLTLGMLLVPGVHVFLKNYDDNNNNNIQFLERIIP